MKKYISIVIILVCLITGWIIYKSNSEINDDVTAVDSINDKQSQKNGESKNSSPDSMTQKEIYKLLNTKQSVLIEETNGIISDDYNTLSIKESHMFFPYILVEELGLTFVIINKIDDWTPVCIMLSENENIKNIGVLGAKPGMNFNEIKEKLGEIDISETWMANEDNIVYELSFDSDDLVYSFISDDEQGTGSVLYISLKKSD